MIRDLRYFFIKICLKLFSKLGLSTLIGTSAAVHRHKSTMDPTEMDS